MTEPQIIYEDSEIIVCIKPIGVLSQSDEKGRSSMIPLLSEHTGTDVFPLHRLDKDVSGVMVFAKTKTSAAFLSKEIAENRFKKEYLAIIHGIPQKQSDRLEDLLFKDSTKGKSYVVKRERKGVKKAILDYELLKTIKYENYTISLIKVLLHTGRTHQIRVQFSYRKMPLVADKKYGASDTFKEIGLFSHSISFTHPKTKEKVSFKVEPKNCIFDYFK